MMLIKAKTREARILNRSTDADDSRGMPQVADRSVVSVGIATIGFESLLVPGWNDSR
jgi:hypothetical protein